MGLIGTIARSSLRETRDFVDAKQRLKRNFDLIKSSTNTSIDFSHQLIQEKTNPKTFLALFCIGCSWPVCFYLCYIHCGNILRESYSFSPAEVIHQNFIVSIVHTLGYFVVAFLSLKIHPMRIVKTKILIFTIFACFLPMLLNSHSQAIHILLIQLFIVICPLTSIPACAIFYKCFPVFQRFKCCSFTYALSRATMHVITSFGMIYIINRFGNWGILIILVPVIIIFTSGILHFCALEKEQKEI